MAASRDPVLLTSDPGAGYRSRKRDILAAIEAALDGGQFILGENVTAFEGEFSTWMGDGLTVGLANGTDAVELCLRAAGIQEGDWVAVPTHTAVATATAVMRAGARPVFIDIDATSYTIDPDALEEACRHPPPGCRLKAVVPVHLYGHPCDLDRLAAIAMHHGLTLIEDCSQAHGATWRGRKVGTFGIAAAFSCYPTKNLGALGDAGLAFTRDAHVAERIRQLRQYGWKTRYLSDDIGMNSRLDEVQAAILRVNLRHLDADIAARCAVAARYREMIEPGVVRLPDAGGPPAGHAYHQFAVLAEDRDELQTHLKDRGILAGILYPAPIHLQHAYHAIARDWPLDRSVAEHVCQHVLCLPIHPHLSAADVARVASGVGEFQKTTSVPTRRAA